MPMGTFVDPHPMDWDSVMPEGLKEADTMKAMSASIDAKRQAIADDIERRRQAMLRAQATMRERLQRDIYEFVSPIKTKPKRKKPKSPKRPS